MNIQIKLSQQTEYFQYIFKSLGMKTTNQFDYPTTTAHTYKKFKPDQTKINEAEAIQQKKRYQQYLKQQKQTERLKVKEEQNRKLQQQKLQTKLKIKSEIERKKKELLELEKQKCQTLDNERKAFELALVKQQQDKIKRIEEQQKKKQNDENANQRFSTALRWLEQEKEQNSYKEKQALLRRKVINDKEREERINATKYQVYLAEKEKEDKERLAQQEKRAFDQYKQGLGRHGFTKNVDYTKTCLHNPRVIFKNLDEEPANAVQKATELEERRKQLSLKKKQKQEETKKLTEQRGRVALQKLQRQREYNEYYRQSQKQQINYNLQRVEAGKRNQYTGIKPLTLQQIENNKKLRSQEEFEQLFLQKVNIEEEDRPATKYQIYEQKMKDPSLTESNFRKLKKDSEESRNRESLIPYPSTGKYSFEERSISSKNQEGENEDEPQRLSHKKLKEYSEYKTKVPNIVEEYTKQKIDEAKSQEQKDKNHELIKKSEQLYYSQSQEDSSV